MSADMNPIKEGEVEQVKNIPELLQEMIDKKKVYYAPVDEQYIRQQLILAPARRFNRSKLIYFRTSVFMVIEQSPHKDSVWAQLKRDGHDVWQVIQRVDNTYYGVIVDKKFYRYWK